MQNTRTISFTFFLALFLALLIAFSQFFKPAPLRSTNAVTHVEKASLTAHASVAFISSRDYLTPSFSLPAPFYIQSHLPICFLFELFAAADDRDENYKEEASLHPNVFFEIVFRLIISPNAP